MATDSLTFLPLGYEVLSPQIWAGLGDVLPLVAEVALLLLLGCLGALSFQLGVQLL